MSFAGAAPAALQFAASAGEKDGSAAAALPRVQAEAMKDKPLQQALPLGASGSGVSALGTQRWSGIGHSTLLPRAQPGRVTGWHSLQRKCSAEAGIAGALARRQWHPHDAGMRRMEGFIGAVKNASMPQEDAHGIGKRG